LPAGFDEPVDDPGEGQDAEHTTAPARYERPDPDPHTDDDAEKGQPEGLSPGDWSMPAA
jgi:hypothetical protein